MTGIIKEPIKVGAVFSNSKIIPKWFIWGNRRFDIASVNYTWKTREGKNIIYRFAVSDDINVFELSYNSGESRWELTAVDVS